MISILCLLGFSSIYLFSVDCWFLVHASAVHHCKTEEKEVEKQEAHDSNHIKSQENQNEILFVLQGQISCDEGWPD